MLGNIPFDIFGTESNLTAEPDRRQPITPLPWRGQFVNPLAVRREKLGNLIGGEECSQCRSSRLGAAPSAASHLLGNTVSVVTGEHEVKGIPGAWRLYLVER